MLRFNSFLLFACLCLGLGSFAEAQAPTSRLYLLLAITPPTKFGPHLANAAENKISKINNRAEALVRQNFQGRRDLHILVVPKATGFDLWTALQDPTTSTILWVSHGAYDGSTSHGKVGLSASRSALIDSGGFDVSPLLYEIPRHIQKIALVACSSSKIVSHLENPNIFVTFDKKITALTGLRQALQMLPSVGSTSDQPSEKSIEPSVLIHLRRTSLEGPADAQFPPFSIVAGSSVLAMAPAIAPNSIYEETLPLSAKLCPSKLVLKTGAYFGKNPLLFEIGAVALSCGGRSYRPFIDPSSGKPFGKTQQIFLLDTK